MRTLILIVALALALCAGCAEEQKGKVSLWGTYETDAVGARVGYAVNGNEVGVYGAWRPASEDPPNIAGVYALHEFATIDVNNPIPLEWLPDKLTATPYLGGYVTVDFADEGRKAMGGPMVGLKVFNAVAFEARYQFVNGPLEASYEDREAVFALTVPIPLR